MSGSDNYPGKPSLDDWERLSATKPAVEGDELVERLRNDEVRQTVETGPDPLCAKAADLIESLSRRMGELERALAKAFGAIASLPEDALGFGQDDHSRWPLRDELLSEIGAVLQGHSSSSGEAK